MLEQLKTCCTEAERYKSRGVEGEGERGEFRWKTYTLSKS
jgi:hypothetical protein